MSKNCELTILMPCLNEERTLAICIQKARTFLENAQLDGEVLIADNGSTDNSVAVAEQAGARVVAVPEKGYGSALRGGIAVAHGQFVIMGDADDSYNFSDLHAFVEALRNGADLVMGNRFQGGIQAGAMPPLHRYLGNPVLSFIGQLFFKIPVGDFHCGLRGFRREQILGLGLKTTGMEFASEMVVKAALGQLKIEEVPTTLAPDGRNRPPHLNTWRDGWRHLKFLLIYSPAWSLLYPGVILFVVGLLLSLTLLPGSQSIGGLRFDVHTLLLASTLCFIGFQLISIFFFAKEHGIHQGYLPADATPRFWDRLFRLENSLLIGGVLFFTGLGLIGYSILFWRSIGYADLDASYTLRYVIAGAFSIVFSVQFMITGFLREMLK
ncbi:MAG: dolichol-P-glucose synthetase [Bacteroidetes bacterium]|nr:MAG: dolichol-P-glucose synthetase [Bacteroidota bacterium]PTM09524.1 MAG: dolichol-P-glucose synthetase [Bacteroidota bacterium]